ncbi:2OG-Fe(II) oxygenase [Streptomyces sp. NRRL S-118]|uniref:2OG-Fe(II) oxygenase n=1 Tax=Streptomyces sp. NRRL S-118 TaxID=1463881 RepID=UPI00099D4154|nr:2OG-Fe(II) oxygenase [Streptomyces sp. NRRL S-118]
MTVSAAPAMPESSLARARRFIDERHLTPAVWQEMREWYTAEPGRPFILRDFLRPEWAGAMDAAMRALPVWSRCATVYTNSRDSREIPEAEWADHPHRAACHFVARPLGEALQNGSITDEHRRTIEQFLAFSVLTDTLRDFITAGVGFPLEPRTSVELAAYRDGDRIRRHQDLFPGRVMAVNFYLDAAHRPGTGGRLGFRNEAGTDELVEPLFNTFSMIPVREECWHWVEPFSGEGTGRYTVSIGQHLLGQAHEARWEGGQ